MLSKNKGINKQRNKGMKQDSGRALEAISHKRRKAKGQSGASKRYMYTFNPRFLIGVKVWLKSLYRNNASISEDAKML